VTTAIGASRRDPTPEPREVSIRASTDGLVAALDALLGAGVVIGGDVIIHVGGVDLIRLDLRALLLSIGAADTPRAAP